MGESGGVGGREKVELLGTPWSVQITIRVTRIVGPGRMQRRSNTGMDERATQIEEMERTGRR